MVSTGKVVGALVGAIGGTVIGYGLFTFGLDLPIPGWPIILLGGVIGYAVGPSSEAADRSVVLNDYEEYELQKVANKGKTTTTLVALVFPPAGYYLVGKTGIAALCFFTAHFGLIAHVVAPFHTRRIIKKSQKRLNRAAD